MFSVNVEIATLVMDVEQRNIPYNWIRAGGKKNGTNIETINTMNFKLHQLECQTFRGSCNFLVLDVERNIRKKNI